MVRRRATGAQHRAHAGRDAAGDVHGSRRERAAALARIAARESDSVRAFVRLPDSARARAETPAHRHNQIAINYFSPRAPVPRIAGRRKLRAPAMSRLPIRTIESAPTEAKERLRLAQKSNGYLPNLLGVLANAPTALETYQTVGAINARTGLSPAEREVVQITAAARNGCGFCAAGHSALARRKLGMSQELIAALRRTEALSDPKLNRLARFTLAVMDKRGQVSDEELADFLEAGYTHANALEVVLGVSLATLCNYANNLARTPLNPELAPYA